MVAYLRGLGLMILMQRNQEKQARLKKKPLGFWIGCGFWKGRADGGGGLRIAGQDWGVRATTSKHFIFHRDLRKYYTCPFFFSKFFSSHHKDSLLCTF